MNDGYDMSASYIYIYILYILHPLNRFAAFVVDPSYIMYINIYIYRERYIYIYQHPLFCLNSDAYLPTSLSH